MVMNKGKCNAPNCKTEVYAKGYCSRHYNQIRLHGRLTPETERITYTEDEKICTEYGCTNPVQAKGLCHTCYKRKQRAEIKAKEIENMMEDIEEDIEGVLDLSPVEEYVTPVKRRVVRRRTNHV